MDRQAIDVLRGHRATERRRARGHLRENGRIVVMLCAFDGPPRILRLHGRGEVLLPGTDGFNDVHGQVPLENLSIPDAERAIIVVHVTRVADSCGYGVPLMHFDGMRPHHAKSSAKKLRIQGLDAHHEAQQQRGASRLDGLPALDG